MKKIKPFLIILFFCAPLRSAGISPRWGCLIGSALPARDAGPAGAAAGNLGRIKDLTTPHALRVILPLSRRLEGMNYQGLPITVESFEAMPRQDQESFLTQAIEAEIAEVRGQAGQVLGDYAAEIEDRGRMEENVRKVENLLLYSQHFLTDQIVRERLANAYSYFSGRTRKSREILDRAQEIRKRLEAGRGELGEESRKGPIVSADPGGRGDESREVREAGRLTPRRPGPIPESVKEKLTAEGRIRLGVLERALRSRGIIEYPGPGGFPRRARVRALSADQDGLIAISLAGINASRRKETLTLAEIGHFGPVESIHPATLDLRHLSVRQRMRAPRSALKGLASRWTESYEIFRKALKYGLPIEAESREGRPFRAKVGLITTDTGRNRFIFVYLTDINGTRHAAAAPLLEGVRLLDRKANLAAPGRHEPGPALPFEWRFKVATLERDKLEPESVRKLSILEQAMRQGLTITYGSGTERLGNRAKVERISADYDKSIFAADVKVNILVSLIASDGTRRLSTLKALEEPRIVSSKPEAPRAAGAAAHKPRIEVPPSVRKKLSRPLAEALELFEQALREGIRLKWMDHHTGAESYGIVEQIIADQSGDILVALDVETTTKGPELFVSTLKAFMTRNSFIDILLGRETLGDLTPRPWIPEPGLIGGPGHADPRIRIPSMDLATEQDWAIETLNVLARALKENLVIEYENERTGKLVRAKVKGIDGVLSYLPIAVLSDVSGKGAMGLTYATFLKRLRIIPFGDTASAGHSDDIRSSTVNEFILRYEGDRIGPADLKRIRRRPGVEILKSDPKMLLVRGEETKLRELIGAMKGWAIFPHQGSTTADHPVELEKIRKIKGVADIKVDVPGALIYIGFTSRKEYQDAATKGLLPRELGRYSMIYSAAGKLIRPA